MIKEKCRKNKLLFAMIVICAAAVSVMVLALIISFRSTETKFVPPEFDENAVKGIPDVPDDLGWSEIDAQVFKFSVCGTLNLEGDTVNIWLTNPEDNSVWIKARMYDGDENILGETGLIKPGEYIKSISILKQKKDDENVSLKIMAYQPDTYYSEGTVILKSVLQRGGRE